MRVLLDSHAFLWYIGNDPQLSKSAELHITASAEAFVSVATLWELSLKHSLGKLTLDQPPDQFFTDHLDKNSFLVLPIEPDHIYLAASLPQSDHKDPFDRVLVAQSKIESLGLISSDRKLDQYGIQRVW